jgi:hypothetical protein
MNQRTIAAFKLLNAFGRRTGRPEVGSQRAKTSRWWEVFAPQTLDEPPLIGMIRFREGFA